LSSISLPDAALIAMDNIVERTSSLFQPTLRLGVTGLSRSGKTVFISSLVHNLLHGGRLPLFDVLQSGRMASARLEPQPDDGIARFQYEDHIRSLVTDRLWPDSTRAISQLRVTIRYESASGWNRMFSSGKLAIDIVDYPGEWLLDLPLLSQTYAQFSANTVALARTGIRRELAQKWLTLASGMRPDAPADETAVRVLAQEFADYLKACKADERSLSTLPPGRFLLPGDLEGSPALTFAPLPDLDDATPARGSLRAMMERRFEAYKSLVVKPFFREHFARLDRQIVLVDALQAINRGPEAVQDLERALGDVLGCFQAGQNSLLSSLVTRRIDRVLIAATKADHLHHESHLRLQMITRRMVQRALERIGMSGAGIDVMALAAVRATREATVKRDGQDLPVVVGTPMPGEIIGSERFDGQRNTAIFPGDLPEQPDHYFQALDENLAMPLPDVSVVRFRPPLLEAGADGISLSIPHIRLDRALQFLLGDRLA
jgi:uncharacterized protein